MDKIGKETNVIKTVFLRKANVAVAAFLIFLNVQNLVAVLLYDAPLRETLIVCGLVVLALVYGLLAVNGYLERIVLYERGFALKSLFTQRFLHNDDIKHVTFLRINMKKMIICITLKNEKQITIRTAKYQDWQPVVDYLQPFKKKETKSRRDD